MESFVQEKFKLIELIEFFYKHYREEKLDWFLPVFKEFEKLRTKIENESTR